MSIRGRLLFPVAVVLVLLPLCAGKVFAFGQRENQLVTAQQLIKEKKYNDAILILTQVMRNTPQEFDRAQALLLQIDRARNLYNEKLAELIKVFNEGNLEKAYQIIKELEALDRAPNKRTLEAQAYARQTATFVYETKRFQALMDKALAMLKAGDYSGAVTTYVSGFDIGLEMFKQANYGNIVTGKVNGIRSDMRGKSDAFLAELKKLDAERAAINADLSRPAALDPAVAQFVGTLGTIEGLSRQIERDSVNLKIEQQSIQLQQGSTQTVPLVDFLERLVHGRADASQPEGILAAIGDAWGTALDSVHAGLQKQALDSLAAARQSYDSGSWQQASAEFATTKSYALLAARASAAWGIRLSVGDSLAIPPAGWQTIRNELPTALEDQLLAQAAASYDSLIPPVKKVRDIAATDTTLRSTAELGTLRKEILGISEELRSGRSTWSRAKGRYTALESQKLDVAPAIGRIDDVLAAYDSALAEADKTTVAIVSREGSAGLTPVVDSLSKTKATVGKATTLLNGIAPTNHSGVVAAALKEKYPDQAKQLLTQAQGELQGYRKTIADHVGFLSKVSSTVQNSQAVKELISKRDQLDSEISTLAKTVSSSLAQANHQIFEANRYRQEGENRLSLAQNDLAQGNFASARQQITQAATSFDKSLSYQESAAVKRIRDGQIPRLSQQIANAENAIVVHDVRDYINRGREFYSQGDYARAQDMFLRAQSRWNLTNTSTNPEITNWLKYVDTALSIDSGRVVSPTDPLYPEITQVLNLAENDYNTARQLLSEGQDAQANALLSEAQTKLIYVQIPFPLNKEARVLSLRILKLSDPKTFAATFRQKFDAAVAELHTNPQSAYVTLKDLQAIDPSFPGLTAEIDHVEIALGMRRPPPDPAKITESKDLYQKAFNIVRQNVRAQYPIAISYLNRAIDLDPNNQLATSLKDRLSIDEGAGATVVMSSGDQLQFKLAQEQFIAKNYYEALRIVNQLLKVPANENYTPLLELKRRIESQI